MNAQVLARRRRALELPPNFTQLSRAELISIVRSSPGNPAQWSPLERLAWRELATRPNR